MAVVLTAPSFVHSGAFSLVETTDFMHARYYSPNLGRFMSVDPVGGTVGSSQSWNRYTYVENRPTIAVDPDGQALDYEVEQRGNLRSGMTAPATPEQLAFDKGIATLIGAGLTLPVATAAVGPTVMKTVITNALAGMAMTWNNVRGSGMNANQQFDTVMTSGAIWGVTGVLGGGSKLGALGTSIVAGTGGDIFGKYASRSFAGQPFTFGDAASAPFSGGISGTATMLGRGNLGLTVGMLIVGSIAQQEVTTNLINSSLPEANESFSLNIEDSLCQDRFRVFDE
jgi:RHS repeat-associated protein